MTDEEALILIIYQLILKYFSVREYNRCMNILFVCKYNNFRSKFAEVIFNELNTDSTHVSLSAGVMTNGTPSIETAESVRKTAQELGYQLAEGKRNVVEMSDWADIIINVANDVQLDVPEHKKVIAWHIDDADKGAGFEERKIIVAKIKQKVIGLISAIESGKI